MKKENKQTLFQKLQPKPAVKRMVEGIGEITIQAPDFDKVVQLAQQNEAIGEKGLKFALTLMSVKELSTEEIIQLATENDGYKIASLINAVKEALNLGEDGVGKPTKD